MANSDFDDGLTYLGNMAELKNEDETVVGEDGIPKYLATYDDGDEYWSSFDDALRAVRMYESLVASGELQRLKKEGLVNGIEAHAKVNDEDDEDDEDEEDDDLIQLVEEPDETGQAEEPTARKEEEEEDRKQLKKLKGEDDSGSDISEPVSKPSKKRASPQKKSIPSKKSKPSTPVPKPPSSKKKSKPSTPTYLGTKVAKYFDNEPYAGVVKKKSGVWWKIVFEDGDQEDWDEDEIKEGTEVWRKEFGDEGSVLDV